MALFFELVAASMAMAFGVMLMVAAFTMWRASAGRPRSRPRRTRTSAKGTPRLREELSQELDQLRLSLREPPDRRGAGSKRRRRQRA